MTRSIPLTLSALLAITAGAPAVAADWNLTALVEEDDPVDGYGWVQRIDNVRVNDSGDWVVLVHAGPFGPGDVGDVLLGPDGVLVGFGQPLPGVPGSTFESVRFNAVTFDELGRVGALVELGGVGAGEVAVWYDERDLLRTGDPVGFAGAPPGATYAELVELETGGGEHLLLSCEVLDPAAPGDLLDALVLLEIDAAGALVAETVLALEGALLPGQTEPVAYVGKHSNTLDLDVTGRAAYLVGIEDGPSTRTAIYVDDVLYAKAGEPSFLPGRDWEQLGTVSLSDTGHIAIVGDTDGPTTSDWGLFLDGELRWLEGDVVDGIAPLSLTPNGFTSPFGDVHVADDGELYWFGRWTDVPGTGAGLFLDEENLVEQGVTTIDGLPIKQMLGIDDQLHAGPKQRYLAFECIVETFTFDDTNGVYLLSPAAGITPHPSCTGNAATLTDLAGAPVLGGTVAFGLDNAQAPGSLSFLSFANAPHAGFPGCGPVLPGIGELLLGVLPPNPLFTLAGSPWFGGPSFVYLSFPTDPALAGIDIWAQGFFVDPALGPELVRLTDLLQITVGT